MKKILVIEDEPLQLDLIADRLGIEFQNVQIDKALNLEEAVGYLDHNSYEVIITDLLQGTINRKDEIKSIATEQTRSTFIVYTVAPESFPNEYCDQKTYVVDKLKPFEEGMLDLVKKALN